MPALNERFGESRHTCFPTKKLNPTALNLQIAKSPNWQYWQFGKIGDPQSPISPCGDVGDFEDFAKHQSYNTPFLKLLNLFKLFIPPRLQLHCFQLAYPFFLLFFLF